MSAQQRLERDLPNILGGLAAGPYPDYIDDVLLTTAARRQRPSWAFPERWLPVELVTQRVPMTRMPWRQVGVLALIALLLGAMLIVYVGSRSPRLPQPFGPAGNGLIGLGRNGDLFTVDPTTKRVTLIVAGPENDEWVGFTPDGTRGVFVRWGPENGGLTAARVGSILLDGRSTPVFVDKDVIHGGSWIELAPNGRDVAFTAFDHLTPDLRINLAALDGSSYRVFEDVPITDYGGLSFLAPDGRELVYVARSADGQRHDIRALDVTTGRTRPIVETTLGTDVFGNVSAAPDGKRLAYALRTETTVSVHVVGTDGSDDLVVGHAPGAMFEAWPQWDPQGERLLIERRDAGDEAVRPVVVDLDGGADVIIDTTISNNGAGKAWAPDGSAILAQRTAEDGRQLQQEVWDARTGAVTQVGWPSIDGPVWQRIAP
jgi:Tol biopolymer transport system component